MIPVLREGFILVISYFCLYNLDVLISISSMVVKGIVCKKNVAHRRMTSKIDKPRFLLLGGALEYQRVSNQLSSVDTLLQQVVHQFQLFEIDNYILNKYAHSYFGAYIGINFPWI
jgi:hypothetical protein